MQVRRFEAKSMNEALKMVKDQLGPEAVILQAKDNQKAFGIGGESSVEITAAISEQKLREHQFAMARLRAEDQQKIKQSPAALQKKFIDRSVKRYTNKQEAAPRRYIDIDDEEAMEQTELISRPTNKSTVDYIKQGKKQLVKSAMNENIQFQEEQTKVLPAKSSVSEAHLEVNTRVKEATKSALKAFSNEWSEESTENTKINSANYEVNELKKEIAKLQSVIQNFQQVPQNFISSHPGAEFGLSYDFSHIFEKLIKKGISKEHIAELCKLCQEELEPMQLKKKHIIEAWFAKQILDSIEIQSEIPNRLRVFVGASSSGKTSSLIKVASRLVVEERKKVAILTTDTFKLGASEQLRIYARILNVPFAIIRSASEWDYVISELDDMDMILVDTPGLSLKSIDEIEMIKKSIPYDFNPHIHYVQSVIMKEADAMETAKRYEMFKFNDITFCKLDESIQHGLIYSLSKSLNKKLYAFGVGARVPEDFEMATKERVLDLIFDLSR